MTTGESRQSFTAEEVKAEVRQTIQQLQELSLTDTSFDEFCETVLTKVVKLTGAHGALLWQSNANGGPRISHKAGRQSFSLDVDESKHLNIVGQVISQQQRFGISSASVARDSETESETNDTNCLMLFAPVFNRTKVCCGALELLQRNDITDSAKEGYLKFLARIAELFPRWHENHEISRLSQNVDQFSTTMDFVSEVHNSIDYQETAFAIANEARRLLGCDRVSFAHWNGSRCKVTAISSQDRFDNRSNVVRLLGKVATSSVAIDRPFWITEGTDGLAPEIARRINEYMDESHCRTLGVIPLTKKPEKNADTQLQPGRREKPKKLGALIIEYFDAEVAQDQISEQCKLIVDHSQIAANNAQIHSEIFLMPLWKRLGNVQKLLFRDHYAKTMTALAALAIFGLLLIFYPAELKMKVEGVIHPEERRHVNTLVEGHVKAVHFGHGEDVKTDDLLIELESPDLDIQLTETLGQIEVIKEKIKETERALSRPQDLDVGEEISLGGQLGQLQDQLVSQEEKVALLGVKKQGMEIRSPIDGKIVTWDLRRRLKDLTVRANQQVISIANFEGDWQTELRIPQNKMGYILRAMMENDNEPLDVEFRVATNPNILLKGKLQNKNVAARADTGQAGVPEFRAIVDADISDLEELRPGAGVTAKVFCGRKQLGFVWFYQIIDFMRTKVFF